MNIEALTLHTRDLNAQRTFYADVLGFPVESVSEEAVTFRAGRTQLTLRRDADFAGPYHFAFNVPEDRFTGARVWLEERVPLLADGAGETRFHFGDWNADAVYFRDGENNILEFIARHTLPAAPGSGFRVADVLGISELGLPVADVPESVRELQGRFGLPTYGEVSATFTPLGEEEGLLIVVPVGRGWFPTGEPARRLPFSLRAQSERGVIHLKEIP